MRERFIPAIIMLIAGAVTSLINILNKVNAVTGLKRLLIVLIIFYFLGLTVRLILKKTMKPKSKPTQEEEEFSEGEEEQPSDKNT
jgi:F0F1-type ATP synthase assembly protein I